MKKILMTTIMCAALLAGCATTGGLDQGKLDALVSDIQKYTTTACNFLPTAASVLEVIGAFSGTPGVGVAVGTVGAAICNGFVTKSVARGGAVTRNVSTPRGVVKVKGTRV